MTFKRWYWKSQCKIIEKMYSPLMIGELLEDMERAGGDITGLLEIDKEGENVLRKRVYERERGLINL